MEIYLKDVPMSRAQLALNVSDLEEAVAFYLALFDAEPAKVRPGYANFAVTDPPLKLVLIEGAGEPGSINHLGVEVVSSDEVAAVAAGLSARGMETAVEDGTTCCYAVRDKVWVDGPDGADGPDGPDGARWEVSTVLADARSPRPWVGTSAAAHRPSPVPSPVPLTGPTPGCC
jgi:catechol 2,3-dioxygenase-like lactoylglutathione lyase family enzyme